MHLRTARRGWVSITEVFGKAEATGEPVNRGCHILINQMRQHNLSRNGTVLHRIASLTPLTCATEAALRTIRSAPFLWPEEIGLKAMLRGVAGDAAIGVQREALFEDEFVLVIRFGELVASAW